MRRLLYLAALVLFLSLPAFGRVKLQGWCQDGGKVITVPGATADTTTTWQQSFASCTVTVYDVGTTNLSTIYSDNSGTAKANPFTAAASGQWFFYADNSRYDVKFSAGGIGTPFTLGDYNLNDQAEQTWTYKSVTFSATPTFDASQNSFFAMTLTANVTSSTVSNAKTGRVIGFQLCQDATGGRTLVWPTSFLRPPTIASGASQCTTATFVYDGTNWRELSTPGDTVRHNFQTQNNIRYADQFFGTTAGAKIINCIADLPSTGGTCDARGLEGAQTISADLFAGVTKPVVLRLGQATYTSSVTITIPTSDIAIIGDGWGTILKPSTATLTPLFSISASTTRITIRDLQLQGLRANDSANQKAITTPTSSAVSKLHIENVLFVGDTGTTGFTYCLVLDGVVDSIFINNYFTLVGNTESRAIDMLNNSNRNLISGNRFDFNSTNGYFGISMRKGCSYNRIVKNHFTGGNSTGASGGSVISALGVTADANAIAGNIFAENIIADYVGASPEALEAGIELGGKSQFNLIIGNTISGVDRHGILVEEDGGLATESIGNMVIGNTVRTSKRSGIYIRGTTDTLVSGNYLVDNGQDAAAPASIRNDITTDWDGAIVALRPRLKGNVTRASGAPTARYGLAVTANTTSAFLEGNSFESAVTGDISDSGVTTRYVHMNESGVLNLGPDLTADGKAIKFIEVTTGSVAGGARADVTVTWTTAFPNATYSAQCSVVDTSAAGAGLVVERIRAKAAGSLTVQVINNAAGALTGTVNCVGLHHP